MKNKEEQERRINESVKRLREETFKRKNGKLIYKEEGMKDSQLIEEYRDRIEIIDSDTNQTKVIFKEKTEYIHYEVDEEKTEVKTEIIFAPTDLKDRLF